MKPPAFQFYASDFLAGVADMNQAEVGAYILLLCHQWGRGEIPQDATRAAMIAKGDVSPHVLAKFPNGKNARMERERDKQAEFRASRSDAGKSGAQKRWQSHSTPNGTAIAEPMAKNGSPSPSSSSSPDSALQNNAVGTANSITRRATRAAPPNDGDWLASLKTKPVYAGLNIENEAQKAQTWCEANSRKFSRKMFTNWLNRAEQSMAPTAAKPKLTWQPEPGGF